MAPTRLTELHYRRVRLTRKPAAAAEARSQVRAVICAWRIPVDPDIAVLLTSDLVTNAIMYGDGQTITLAIRCSCLHLRVDVYYAPRSLPMAVDDPAVTETGHGLVLVATLSTEWGSFLTPASKVVYFTLVFQSDVPPGSDPAAADGQTRDREPGTPSGSSSPLGAHSRRRQPVKGDMESVPLRSPHERPSSGSYWIKSSLSYANGNCVEVASLPGGEIGVRNSRDSAGPVLRFTSQEWLAFLGGVRNGEFDSIGI